MASLSALADGSDSTQRAQAFEHTKRIIDAAATSSESHDLAKLGTLLEQRAQLFREAQRRGLGNAIDGAQHCVVVSLHTTGCHVLHRWSIGIQSPHTGLYIANLAPVNLRSLTCMCTCMHVHACVHVHVHICAHMCMCMSRQTDRHTCAGAHTHRHAHAHARERDTHVCARTHTLSLSLSLSLRGCVHAHMHAYATVLARAVDVAGR